jgi:hypothetical protein
LHRRHILALFGAILALTLSSTAAALATSGPAVTVRVEGAKRTLLAPTIVHGRSGSITKGGAKKGACPASTAAGALDAATKHRWSGRWSKKYQALLVTAILGEKHTLNSKLYWSVWVDNTYAQSGICGLELHSGEQLLFAAVPDSFSGSPLALKGPHRATAGHSLKVKVTSFTAKGKATALAGAQVSGSGAAAVTNSHGIATILPSKTGTLVLHAVDKGYIRAAPLRVRVTG